MARRKGRVLMVLGLLCLLAAGGIAGFYVWQDWHAGESAKSVLAQLETADVQESAGDGAAAGAATGGIADDGVAIVDGNAYKGRIVVPSANIELPVLDEWSMENLEIAPCRYSGGYYTNDLVIAGHSYSQHFGSLNNVSVGDDVYFVTAKGKSLHYTVAAVEVLDPVQVEDMVSSAYDLSLFTCTSDGFARHTVRCMRAFE